MEDALIVALFRNDLVTVRRQLTCHQVTINEANFDVICSRGFKEMAILLIKNGCKITGRTIAITQLRDQTELVRMLILFKNPQTRKLAELLYY